MKLIRFGKQGAEKPGMLDKQGKRRDLSIEFSDWNRSFFQNGGLEKLRGLNPEKYPRGRCQGTSRLLCFTSW
ncbi:hypothetical protein [Maribacter litopenaei]|uniref:hypothetical protein n=1 Tax=Maribacter litopenaei TaxID=2976127 RepID=UPI0030840687